MKKILIFFLAFIGLFLSSKAQSLSVTEFSVASKYLKSPTVILLTEDPTKVDFKITVSGSRSLAFYAEVDVVYTTSDQPDEVLYHHTLNNFSLSNSGFLVINAQVSIPTSKTQGQIKLRVLMQPGVGGSYHTYASNSFTCVLPTPLGNNIISFIGNPNLLDDFAVKGTQPTGGRTSYTYIWEIVDDNNVKVSPLMLGGISESLNQWNKNNTIILPIFEQKKLYLRRIIKSGNETIISNKIPITYWSGTNRTVTAKIQTGDLAKCIQLNPMNFTNVSGAGVDFSMLCNWVEGATIEVNSLFLRPDDYAFRIDNPAPNVTYKWYFLTEDVAISGEILTGQIVNVLNHPVSGNRTNTMYIYGSDGSRTKVSLPTMNVL